MNCPVVGLNNRKDCSVDDSYPELFDARELGDSDGGRVAASHGAHLDVHLEVALDSEKINGLG